MLHQVYEQDAITASQFENKRITSGANGQIGRVAKNNTGFDANFNTGSCHVYTYIHKISCIA